MPNFTRPKHFGTNSRSNSDFLTIHPQAHAGDHKPCIIYQHFRPWICG